ncbi:MAG: PAS domain-containing protein [Rhodospirillales bacterium]|nr:PAS domain-containing protein [Rhodospirillales bacterium]
MTDPLPNGVRPPGPAAGALDFEGTHPRLGDLFRLWDAKRAARQIPARGDIDVLELRPWLGNLMLLEIVDGGADFFYRVYGSTLAGYFGRDFTGKHLNELPENVRSAVGAEYRTVTATRAPLVVSHRRSIMRQYMTVSKLILPLGIYDAAADMLLVGVFRMD